MAGEKMTTNTESGAQGLKSDFPTKPERDMAAKKDGVQHNGAAAPFLGLDPAFIADQSLYYSLPPGYGYYFPGFEGFPPVDDQGYLSTGVTSDNGSPYYYLPYNPYATGFPFSDVENPYQSSGFVQPPGLYKPAALDGGDKLAKKSENLKPMPAANNGPAKFNGYNAPKMMNSSLCKPTDWTLNSNAKEFAAPHKSLSQTCGPLYKQSGYGFHHPGNINGVYPNRKYSPFTGPNQGALMQYGSMNCQQNRRVWNGNQRFRPKYNYRQDGYVESSFEITRGPRTKGDPSKLLPDDAQKEQNVDKSIYNLEDFQTEYENAKFYVIKSYSEDDVHKSVKYSVWSSTPKGNKKLDDSFQDANAKATETGAKHPIFLMFSVNGSGQFVGAAEMTGPVDFDKNMDFWQVDKWSGFFPLKWHIVKDLPNHLFRHIILENNEDRAVTHSRDTQEVGLKEGLEMLSIFKSYLAKSSLLDDFNFYENREKSLKVKRSFKPVSVTSNGFPKLVTGEERVIEEESKIDVGDDISSSLVDLTKNLTFEELQSMKPITC